MTPTIDLGSLSIIINLLGAFGAIWVMQVVTMDYNFTSVPGLVKLGHRLLFCGLAVVLFYNAMWTLWAADDPRGVDLLAQGALLAVLGLSAARHMMAPRLAAKLTRAAARG